MTLVAAGNGRCFGGGMQLFAAASPSDGCLQVVALDGLGAFALLRYQGRLRRGEVDGIAGVSVHTCRQRLEVQLEGGGSSGGEEARRGRRRLGRWGLPVECDGELVDRCCSQVVMEVLPGALRMHM